MKAEDLHYIANKKGILWDNDPVFKMICRQLTGKEHLDDMSSSELQRVYEEITTSPAVFSKAQNSSLDQLFIRKNYDYGSGDFLDRLRGRKRAILKR